VRRIVDAGYKSATEILGGNREALTRIAEALLEREVLDASEIKLLIEGKELPKLTPKSDDEGVQQVLKPEPARAPGMAPGQQPA
jgi:cell division protease FtsH